MPDTFIIIGGGASGVLVAVQLLRHASEPCTIILIEPSADLGRGIAYNSHNPLYLLNVRADNMSAFPDNPSHFLNWARQRSNGVGVTAESFLPRCWYADYLQAILKEAIARAQPGVVLEWRQATVIGMTPCTNQMELLLDDGTTRHARQIILALGNAAPSIPAANAPASRMLNGFDLALIERHIAPDEPVLLIGSGLTMIDVALTLHASGHTASLYAVSRHGLLPQVHQPRQPYPAFFAMPATGTSIRALLRTIRNEIQIAAGAGYPWQSVIDTLRPITQQIWMALSLSERRRFLRHLRTYWDVHRHRIAPDVKRTIDQLRHTEQLRIYAGRVIEYRADAHGIDVTIQERHTQNQLVLRAGYVINCTGPATDYDTLSHPLIANMRDQGLLRSDPLHLGLDTDREGRIIQRDGTISSMLSTLGPPRKGELWECTAMPDIRNEAAALARRLLNMP